MINIGKAIGTVIHHTATFNSLTTKKHTTKFSKNIKSKLHHIENSKTRGQTV